MRDPAWWLALPLTWGLARVWFFFRGNRSPRRQRSTVGRVLRGMQFVLFSPLVGPIEIAHRQKRFNVVSYWIWTIALIAYTSIKLALS